MLNDDVNSGRVYYSWNTIPVGCQQRRLRAASVLTVINFINAGNDNLATAALDTDDDGEVAASDVLSVINYINAFGSTKRSPSMPPGRLDADADLSHIDTLLLLLASMHRRTQEEGGRDGNTASIVSRPWSSRDHVVQLWREKSQGHSDFQRSIT
jgi:hypothetical protein